MKIGNLEIKFAEKKSLPPAEKDELGSTGTTFFGGSLSENEYNTDLRGSKGIAIYDKMRRSDARVASTLKYCELPLRAVTWSVEPASDDNRDEEIAQALEDNLFGMSITWDSFLHHVLLMLPFGFSLFEKVWDIQDGQVRYRKLAPRLPSTLYQWDLDENGGLNGIKQATWKGGKYEIISIPSEKLLVFTNEKEGSNFEGISILRTAYKHWYYKDNLYRIDGIAAERHALGIPHFTTPGNATKEEKDKLDEIGQRLYAQEQGFVRTADGYTFEVKGLSGTIKDIMPSIQHHDKKIAESVLADFIDLGAGDRGSWALSKDKSSFFLMALKSVAVNIQDTMNAYVIPQWVDYNYPNVQAYPKLTAGKLETRNMKEYADAIVELLTSGGLTPGEDIENNLRDMLELPPKPEEEPTQTAEKRIFTTGEKKYRRELTMAEKAVQFSEIDDRLNKAEQDIIKAAGEVQKRQIEKLVDVVSRIIEKRDMSKLEDIDVPFRADMAKAIEETLLELYKYGREQVKAELTAQAHSKMAEPIPLAPDEIALIQEFLKTRAKANVSLLATKLKAAVTFEALNQIRQGVLDKVALTKVMTDLSDKELLNTAQYSIAEAFGFGRSSEADKHQSEIASVQYSALLDDTTCNVCSKLDGREWDYNDERTNKYARGNPDCDGRTRCRCLLVYINKSERRNP